MHKALMWKEWREQRPVMLTGLLVTVLMPFFLLAGMSLRPQPVSLDSLSEALPGFYLALLWPLFAAAAGAGTVASEKGDNTLGFLLSRPVSRVRVWGIKVLLAAATFLAVALSSVAVSWLLFLLADGGAFLWEPFLWEEGGFEMFGWFVLGSLFLVFAASVFFSTLLSRTMTAAAAGLVAALALLSALLLLWTRIELAPLFEPQWFSLELVLVGVILLLAALYVFCRGEMLRGRGARMTTLVAGLSALAAMGLITFPVIFASVQLSIEDAELWDARLSPSGDALIATAGRDGGYGSPQVWLIPTDGSPKQQLTGRLTFSPAYSPDGEWVAYFSLRGALGLRSSGPPELRLVSVDGGKDHRIPAGDLSLNYKPLELDEEPELLFSPDGSRLLVLDWSELVRIVDLQTGETVLADLDKAPGQDGGRSAAPMGGATPIGWTADGSAVLLFRSSGWDDDEGGAIGTFDVATGRVRVIFESEDRLYNPRWPGHWVDQPEAPNDELLLIARHGEISESDEILVTHELLRLEVETGAVTPIAASVCAPYYDVDEEAHHLFYITCSEGRWNEDRDATLHRRDLLSGDEQTIATIPLGRGFSDVQVSPAGDRVAVRTSSGIVLVALDGSTSSLGTESWSVLGWSGRDRLVVHDYMRGYLVADLSEGTETEIFP